jgi:hypothetical protein
MYGVPADLDLSRFKNATLESLGIGLFQIQFQFHPQSCISVMGKWELRDSSGALVDEALDTVGERESYRVHVVLGKSVESYLVSAPDSFSLRFESGHTLTIFDDSKQYESFSIQPGDIFV